MFRYCWIIVAFLTYSAAQAQMSLSDQIASVRAVQDGERARQEAIQQATRDRDGLIAAQQRATAHAIEQQHIAGQVAIEQQHAKIRNRMLAEAAADKMRDQNYEDQLQSVQLEHAKLLLLEEQQKATSDKQRDQAYQDKLRDIEIQQKLLDVKRGEVRVSRENDVIDHELRQTDVVQSGPDATRNVSQGAKSYMQGIGSAAGKSESKPEVGVIIAR